jgi:hypothetical protein
LPKIINTKENSPGMGGIEIFALSDWCNLTIEISYVYELIGAEIIFSPFHSV